MNSLPVAAWAHAWSRLGRVEMVGGARPGSILLDGPWGVTPLHLPVATPPASSLRGVPTGWSAEDTLQRVAQRLITYYSPTMRRHLRFWRKFFTEQRPAALVVVNDSVPVARAAIACAHENRIPTFTTHSCLHTPGAMYADLAAHHICAQDLTMQDCLERAGIGPDRVRVTGFLHEGRPAPDPSLHLGPDSTTNVRRLLVCTENNGAHIFLDALSRLAAWVADQPDRELRLRIHPDEDASVFTTSCQGSRIKFSKTTLDADLEWADALVTGGTTVGWQAIHRAVPVVTFTMVPFAWSPYGLRGEAIRIDSLDELGSALAALSDPVRRRELAECRANWIADQHLPDDPVADACAFISEVLQGNDELPSLTR